MRIDEDGDVEERASSHHGYNYRPSAANLVSDAGIGPLRDVVEAVGVRAENGWGPETGLLLVSGGSHAGNLGDEPGGRYTPAAAVHLVPLEPIAAADSTAFAISPPWLKQVWRDPEAEEHRLTGRTLPLQAYTWPMQRSRSLPVSRACR